MSFLLPPTGVKVSPRVCQIHIVTFRLKILIQECPVAYLAFAIFFSKVSKPAGMEESEARPLPQELTASTALALWYELMQNQIMQGHPLNTVDNLGFNFLHYASLEGNSKS
jgi:hypothetical protein